MDNSEWIYDALKEMFEGFGIEVTDDMSDDISLYSKKISDGFTEGYYCSSDYLADGNIAAGIQNNEKREIESLKNELDALYSAIKTKGYSFYYNGKCVHEVGVEYVGGTISAGYDSPVE